MNAALDAPEVVVKREWSQEREVLRRKIRWAQMGAEKLGAVDAAKACDVVLHALIYGPREEVHAALVRLRGIIR